MMRIIKIEAESNGFHDNKLGTVPSVPDGYAVVPDNMDLTENFPFVDIAVDNSTPPVVLTICKHKKQKQTTTAEVEVALAELAETESQHDLENKLAIAELAETMTGGTDNG